VRILVISDIHANLEGFEACLTAVPKYDLVANLGDIVGYGGSPNEVTDRSRQTGAIFVRGNHDKACTGITGIEEFNPIAGLAALWTKQVLTPENFEWLKALPMGPIQMTGVWGKEHPPQNGNVQCVHGSPLDEDEYIIVMRDAYEPLLHTEASVTFFGHTHIQGGFCKRGDEWETLRPVYRTRKSTESCDLALMPGAKYLINPGSAGQPRDGDWRAACLLFDTAENRVTFYRVPYAVEKAQKAITDAKLPDRLATRLSEGR
jgi:predicted phosphodiesterase